MLEYYRLYLPKSKREVKIEVSVPRNRDNVLFDTIYFLDGQNAFKDSHASFGRSIRAARALGLAAKEMGKRILGVAIYNSESDMGRINEYTPFKIINAAFDEWKKQDINVFLYVGKQEQSDDIYDKSIYYKSSLELYDYFKNNNTRTRLSIDSLGIHNEETWGNHIIDFINFIYFDDIHYSI